MIDFTPTIQSLSLPNPFPKIDVLRLDLSHPLLSGNKLYKLHYSISEAKQLGKDTLLTFGGAYSNHLVATAYAAQQNGFRSIGVVRGDELQHSSLNPTLSTCKALGMELVFVDRTTYRQKEVAPSIQNLLNDSVYMIPEGGTNALAVKGASEILNSQHQVYNYKCIAVGTGGTMAGILESAQQHQKVMGYPVLKNAQFLENEIKKYTQNLNFELILSHHFGGYGKTQTPLIEFINRFYKEHQIPLDPIYTGKMFYGVFDDIQQNKYSSQDYLLLIHTGGLQGIIGYNESVKNKENKINLYE